MAKRRLGDIQQLMTKINVDDHPSSPAKKPLNDGADDGSGCDHQTSRSLENTPAADSIVSTKPGSGIGGDCDRRKRKNMKYNSGWEVHVTQDSTGFMDSSSQSCISKVVLGKDEPAIHIYSKHIAAQICTTSTSKPLLICLALKDLSPKYLHSVAELVLDNKVW